MKNAAFKKAAFLRKKRLAVVETAAISSLSTILSALASIGAAKVSAWAEFAARSRSFATAVSHRSAWASILLLTSKVDHQRFTLERLAIQSILCLIGRVGRVHTDKRKTSGSS